MKSKTIFKIKKMRKYKNTMKQKKWNNSEDKFILEIKNKTPKIKWNSLQKAYNEKFEKNKKTYIIRAREKLISNPGVKRNKLPKEERNTILEFYRIYGPRWSLIKKNFPDR